MNRAMFELERIKGSYGEETLEVHFQKPATVKEFVDLLCEHEKQVALGGDISFVVDDNHEEAWHLHNAFWGREDSHYPRKIAEHRYGYISEPNCLGDIAGRYVSRATLVDSWGNRYYFLSLESDGEVKSDGKPDPG